MMFIWKTLHTLTVCEKKKEEIRSKNKKKALEPPLMGPSHVNTKYSLCPILTSHNTNELI